MTSEQLTTPLRAAPPPRRRLQRWVSGGFDPPPVPPRPVRLLLGLGTATGTTVVTEAETGALTGLPRGGLGVLVPSYVARCEAQRHVAAVRHVLDRLAPVRRTHPALPITLWIGMQSGDEHADAAIERLRSIGSSLPGPARLPVVGLAMAGRGKLHTTNAALRVTRGLGYLGWLWIDDDVELDQNCLVRLVSRFLERGAVGAVGAHETALVTPTRPARMMDAVSHHTVPPSSYPAAGCMLVDTALVVDGIPHRRLADDGFVLFELLAEARDGQRPDFDVVAEARYTFYRVGRSGDTLRRLRRSLYSHTTSMADYPWPTARRYFSQFLFYGLWPLAPWDNRRGIARGLLRWAVKAVHFGWFSALVLALVLRHLVGRPVRRVAWGDDGDFRTPLGPATGTVTGDDDDGT